MWDNMLNLGVSSSDRLKRLDEATRLHRAEGDCGNEGICPRARSTSSSSKRTRDKEDPHMIIATAGEEEQTEGQRPILMPEIHGPTEEERRQHWACGHIPYRAWCKECVAGQGRDRKHYIQNDAGELETPLVAMDYAQMTTKEKGQEDKREE